MKGRTLKQVLQDIDTAPTREKQAIFAEIIAAAQTVGYELFETDLVKPWGGYIRFVDANANQFINEFFPEIDPIDARLGQAGATLSPKILLAAPEQRLSWQYHHRRAERWKFLSPGGFSASPGDEQGEPTQASPGESLQIAQGERHRLIGGTAMYTVVAEIWQHTDPENLSDEADIVRVQDDYQR